MARILVPDLQPGARYAVQLRSNDGDAVSQWSPILYVDIDTGTIGPENVTGLTWDVSDVDFHASWLPVLFNTDDSELKDLDYYEVTVSSAGFSRTYTTTNTHFTLPLSENRDAFDGIARATVTVAVQAVNRMGVKSPVATSLTNTNPAPAAPVSATVTAYTNLISLEWDAVADTDVTAYVIYRGTTATFTANATTEVWRGSALAATHHTTDYSTDHYYKIAAVDVFGTVGAVITKGPVRPLSVTGGMDTTSPDAPSNLVVTSALNADTSGAFVDLTADWNAAVATDTSLSHYEVRYSTDQANWNYIIVPSDDTVTVIRRLPAGSSYYVSVRAVDFASNESAWVNATAYPVATQGDTAAPSTPAAPGAATSTQRIQVTHNKMRADGITPLEADLDHFQVFASNTANFVADNTTMLGTMLARATAIETFDIPAASATGTSETWYVKVKPVDRAGNVGPVSAETTATVNLILTANIGQAQITQAHIGSLVVNDILATEGIVNNLIIKSTLTLGDGTTNGIIKSFDYAPGSAGFSLGSNGLEINKGSVSADALLIQNSPNILPTQYAGFEFESGYYTNEVGVWQTGLFVTINNTDQLFERNCLGITHDPDVATTRTLYFGNSDTNYNVDVVAGETYIHSIYVKNANTVNQVVRLGVKFDNATVVESTNFTVTTTGGWTRFSYNVLVPSGVKKLVTYLETDDTTVNIRLDGHQFERLDGKDIGPGDWKRPGITSIDGSAVATGFINTDRLETASLKARHIDVGNITSEHLESALTLSTQIVAGNKDTAGNLLTPYLSLNANGLELRVTDATSGMEDTVVQISPTAGSTFEGDVTAKNLTILETASFRGDTEIARSATFTMQQGTTYPAQAPTVVHDFQNEAFKPCDPATIPQFGPYDRAALTGTTLPTVPGVIKGIAFDPTTQQWYVHEKWNGDRGSTFWTYDVNKNPLRVHHWEASAGNSYRGLAVVNGEIFCTYENDDTTGSSKMWRYKIPKLTLPANADMTFSSPTWFQERLTRIILGIGTNFIDNRIVISHYAVNTTNCFVFKEFNTNSRDTHFSSVTTVQNSDFAYKNYAIAAHRGYFDLNQDRYVLLVTNTDSYETEVFDALAASPTRIVSERWETYRGSSDTHGGLAWTGTNFVGVPQKDATWTTYAGHIGGESKLMWVTSTWFDSDGNFIKDSSFENGTDNFTGWMGTISRTTEVVAFDGQWSLRATTGATTPTEMGVAISGTDKAHPIVPNTQYTFSFYARSAVTARRLWLWVRWKDINNVVVRADLIDSGLSTTTTGWTRASTTQTSPAGAVMVETYALVRPTTGNLATDEVHYFDGMMFHPGAVRAYDPTYLSHETNKGRIRYLTIYNREFMTVTGGTYPAYEDANSPNAIRFYIAMSDTTPFTEDYKYHGMTPNNQRTITIDKYSTTGRGAPLTNEFPTAVPSKIQSSANTYDGKPLLSLDATGEVRIHRLHITHDAASSANSNNSPGLRVGDLSYDHLRIGSEAIFAMLGDSTQGTLYLNPGGKVVVDNLIASDNTAKQVGTAGQPAYQNGWADNTATGGTTTFRKLASGLVAVAFDCAIPSGGGGNTVIFTLPVGYRPSVPFNSTFVWQNVAADLATVNVETNGNVRWFHQGNTGGTRTAGNVIFPAAIT